MPSRPHGTVAVLVVLAVLLSPAVSTVSVTAAPDDTGTYAVAQGTTCTPVAPVSNTSQNVTTFYDYRNPYPEITGRPYATTYSSYGTDEYQISDGSSLFFYTGSEGTSLVVLHDRLGDDEGEPGGSTVTFDIFGLPDGEWAVQDDRYPGRDDNWDIGGSTAFIDWKWAGSRTDGGAYRGFESLDGGVEIDPGFNGNADKWGDWGNSGSEEYRLTEWVLWGADGSATTLDMDRRLFVHRGGCGGEPPAASLTAPDTPAEDENVTLDASESVDDEEIGGYEWDFDGDGETDRVTRGPTVDHAFAEPGEHTVSVTAFDTRGNGDTASVTVNVTPTNDPPTASLSLPTNATTVGTELVLDASESTDDVGIVQYEWDFDGDGTTDLTTETPSVSHIYDESGDYTPSVTVVDTNGETDTASASLSVTPSEPPTAALSVPDTVTVGESVTFDAGDSDDDQSVVEYAWDFDGDGRIDRETIESSVTHTYSETGEFDPSVTVTDADGLTDTATATVTVDGPDRPPTAELVAPTNVTAGESVTFDASGSDDDRGIDAYEWDWNGDGEIDETTDYAEVDHSFDAAGTYTVSVTVVDTNGSTASANASVEVAPNPGPNASLTAPANGSVNESLRFDASESTGDIVEYQWDWNEDGEIDDTTESGEISLLFAEPGTYAVTVRVVDALGDTDNATTSVTISRPSEPPTAVLSVPSNATVDQSVTFNASESTDDTGIREYRWDWNGDGEIDETTEAPTLTHAYEEPDTYDVTVIVVDEDGQTATTSAALEVDPARPSFSAALSAAENARVNQSVTFDASESTGEIVEYQWDWNDDGETDRVTDTPVVDHAYADPGASFESESDGVLRADGTTWNGATGVARDGRRLERLPGVRAFAFVWQDDHGPDAFYHPD